MKGNEVRLRAVRMPRMSESFSVGDLPTVFTATPSMDPSVVESVVTALSVDSLRADKARALRDVSDMLVGNGRRGGDRPLRPVSD